MSVIIASLQGRFGNQILTWLFCRSLAEQTGSELRIDPWIGERVFNLEHARPLPLARRVNAREALQWAALLPHERGDIEIRDYCQHQSAVIYTKRQAQAWLVFRPEIEAACVAAIHADRCGEPDTIVCHQRLGDYAGYGYPMIDLYAYKQACAEFGLDWHGRGTVVLTEEEPTPHVPHLPDELAFLPDFYRMVKAPTLLRGNSSFSWCAALLGHGLVLSPVIDGLEGGKKHVCKFVAGNHPRFAPHLDFVTDLFVAP